MASLLNIPLEVLLQITSYLTTPEYGYLRRTCKQIEASLFGTFTKEFFSKRQFALIEFSIRTLVDIAKSRLGPSLTHLIIHLEHLDMSSHYTPGGLPFHEGDSSRFLRYNQYYHEFISQYEFIYTGLDLEMLTDAIKHLPNLKTVGIRDFNSKNRHRDDTVWKSYGCPTFVEETKGKLLVPPNLLLPVFARRGPAYTGYVFLTILRAIGNAAVSDSGPHITGIEVLLHTSNFEDQFFKIPAHLDAGISLALSSLKTILLDGLGFVEVFPFVALADGENGVNSTDFFLSRFLVKIPALEHLRLNFKFSATRGPERFLGWLAGTGTETETETETETGKGSGRERDDGTGNASCSLASAIAARSLPVPYPPTPDFPNLHSLELGMLTVREGALIALVNKYKSTLRTLSFHKATIEFPTNAKINVWARLCNSIAEVDPALEKLQLSYMKILGRGYSGEVTIRGSKDKNVIVWRGAAFRRAVRDITSAMEVAWLVRWPSRHSSSNSDGDDDGSFTQFLSFFLFFS
ncbi:hypothetical protein GGS21DRAFT_516949 [Xylaria nigripes]|nr:hypothetical protein GGS21DRAFT_516949 [Xylaria nigripes]